METALLIFLVIIGMCVAIGGIIEHEMQKRHIKRMRVAIMRGFLRGLEEELERRKGAVP